MKIFLKLSACVVPAVAYGLMLVLYPFSPVTFALGIPVCLWLSSLFHELGHLTAYLLLKLKWKRIVISFFVFDTERGFYFDGQRSIFSASCTCVYSPRIPFWRYCVALLGGGILCGLLGIATILLSLTATGSLAAFLQCFGLISLVNAAATLLLPFNPDRTLLRQIRNEREKRP